MIEQILNSVKRLFFDTAPVVYYFEQTPPYVQRITAIFDALGQKRFTGVFSPITLAECLVHPIRQNDLALQELYHDLIAAGDYNSFFETSRTIAKEAARLRAGYNLSLTDAIQVATAIEAGCDAFLTNDKGLRRVTELNILVLEDLTV